MEAEEHGWITMVPGIRRQTLASGEKLMLMRVQLDAGSHLPEHQHPHEQLTYVLRGRLRMRIGGLLHER
jgi:quercetin dioxygenase-like cupin family protein